MNTVDRVVQPMRKSGMLFGLGAGIAVVVAALLSNYLADPMAWFIGGLAWGAYGLILRRDELRTARQKLLLLLYLGSTLGFLSWVKGHYFY